MRREKARRKVGRWSLIVTAQWVSSARHWGQRAMQPFETIYVEENIVACNGGGGPLGHPRVYLNLSARAKAKCPYCSRLFVRGQPPHPESGSRPQTPAS